MALRMVDISTESYTCPPLTDADYHTSSRLTSPKSSRKESRSPMAASKGPAFGENGDYAEEKLTIDPRRFTPTLHANLVSEILALRREVEQKNNLVLNLEEHIAQTRDENATLNNLISSSSREKKSLKRQMDALENGTLAAIEDIARERDQAIESLADIKVQLERSQKKVKGQEEDINRTQDIWQRDQENWKTERRGFERKIHVVEGRLKTVLTEVAAQSNSQRRSFDNPQYWARERSSSRASGQRSAASHYRDSSITGGQITGKTLADELNIESVSDADSEDYDSAEALPEELERPRSYSSHSNRQSIKARKLLGLPIDATDDTGSFRDSVHKRYSQALSTHITTPSTPVYRDTATQYSPPPSPKMIPDQQRLSTITEFDGESMLDEPMLRPWSSEFERVRFIQMVSSACQTIETPLSPPETPVRSKSEHSEIRRPIMTTNSTQTSENLFTATMGLRTSVPLIAIHPVNSDNGVVLPPNSRNASTQAHIMGDVTSTAVQTDTIRTDERLTKLPAHLHPAIIQPVSPAPSLAPSPAPEAQQEKEINRDLPSSSWPRLQISHQKANVARSILRRSVLTATKDQHHSEDDLSDDSFLNKISTKKILSKVNDSWQMVSSPIDINENITDTEDTPLQLSNLELSDSNLKAPRSMASSPPKKMKGRASQMSQIPGSVSSQPKRFSTDSQTNIGRVRSPSEPIRPDRTNGLPFPVPDRSSSRKFPWLTDDGMESPTPKSGKNNKWHRPPKRRPGIRKSRSEIGDRQFRSHSRSPSPQPFDVFTDSLANIPPPLPENEITTPRSTTLRKPSIVQSAPSQTESTRSDQTTIVDSIAQTMIGEWMYKYVRRRKSFGIPDEAGTGESSVNGGIRHQRWVWVAPYERAVMWSSRQPTSGTALMGKSGRKCEFTISLDRVEFLLRVCSGYIIGSGCS